MRETIVVVDFGSQYSQLIARRVRECRVYSEIVPWNASWEQVSTLNPRGFVLSGGPASVYEHGAPTAMPYIFASDLPVLGICYGMHLLAHQLNGEVSSGIKREYGHAVVRPIGETHPIFAGLPETFPVWMSHGDQVARVPEDFVVLARSDNSPVAAMAGGRMVGLQFHPEVAHTPLGKEIIRNFVQRLCGCAGEWTPGSFIEQSVVEIREQVGGRRVICGLSGGVDSAVTAVLVHRAIGDHLTCIFVNNGMLREGEAESVVEMFRRHLRIDLRDVDAGERFIERLRGVIDPEQKRRIIGEEFIRVFEAEASRLGQIDFLAQGTLYPDVIESASKDTQTASRIKTHHNVGGLPDEIAFSLVEPLRHLFKDEVRAVGEELGLPEDMVWRHPFPGPGLAIRVIGEVTGERLATLRAADAIFIEELRRANLYRTVAQALAVLTPLQTVGVMGDFRTYANVVALRAVTSEDYMTADWARLPYEVLATAASRIINEVRGVNRVVYDISSKPPSTIEWE